MAHKQGPPKRHCSAASALPCEAARAHCARDPRPRPAERGQQPVVPAERVRGLEPSFARTNPAHVAAIEPSFLKLGARVKMSTASAFGMLLALPFEVRRALAASGAGALLVFRRGGGADCA